MIAPSLLILIFLTVQAALYFYARDVALQAAREGVSDLRLSQTPEACFAALGQVHDEVYAFATTVGRGALLSPDPQVTAQSCRYQPNGGSTVSVEVDGESISLIGFSIKVHESATGSVEQFQNDQG